VHLPLKRILSFCVICVSPGKATQFAFLSPYFPEVTPPSTNLRRPQECASRTKLGLAQDPKVSALPILVPNVFPRFPFVRVDLVSFFPLVEKSLLRCINHSSVSTSHRTGQSYLSQHPASPLLSRAQLHFSTCYRIFFFNISFHPTKYCVSLTLPLKRIYRHRPLAKTGRLLRESRWFPRGQTLGFPCSCFLHVPLKYTLFFSPVVHAPQPPSHFSPPSMEVPYKHSPQVPPLT